MSLYSHERLTGYSPPYGDRMWGIWGSYYTVHEAGFYLLKGEHSIQSCRLRLTARHPPVAAVGSGCSFLWLAGNEVLVRKAKCHTLWDFMGTTL